MLVSVRNLSDRLLSITDAMYDPSATAVVAAVLMALGPNSGNDTHGRVQRGAHARRCRSVARHPTSPCVASQRMTSMGAIMTPQNSRPGNKIVDYHGAGDEGKHFYVSAYCLWSFGRDENAARRYRASGPYP